MTFSLPRVVARGVTALGAALLLGTTGGSARLDSFVASGAYARARALAADCTQPFLPMLDSADRRIRQVVEQANSRRGGPAADAEGEENTPDLVTATLPLGAELAYDYRTYPEDSPNALLHQERRYDSTYHVLTDTATRVDSYMADQGTLVTVASRASAAGCQRVVIKHQPVAEIGQSEGAVWLVHRFLQKYQQYNRMNATTGFPMLHYVKSNDQWNQDVPAIDADSIIIPVVVKVYKDGVPQANEQVRLWTDARGLPEAGYRSVPHAHIVAGRDNQEWVQSSIDYRDYRGPTSDAERAKRKENIIKSRRRTDVSYAKPLSLTTGPNGETPVTLFSPGYRGGPEAFVATLVSNPKVVALSSIQLAALDASGGVPFAHFADGIVVDGKRPSGASDEWPINLVGNNGAVHGFGHFVQRNRLYSFQSMWKAVWREDLHERFPREKHYLTLNQMSFEYGGSTNPNRSPVCNTRVASRYSHSYGIDFDMNPCAGGGPNGTDIISGNQCLATNGRGTRANPHINDDILIKHVLQRGGVIYEHVPPDPTPHHYHIRFPYHPPRSMAPR